MEAKRRIKVSKYLSKHLRHQPERLGLVLQPGGWVDVDQLLAACARHGMVVAHAELAEVVRTNDKQRFAFDASGTRIRANQGHSVAVDLLLEPKEPPTLLYHGTATHTWPAIAREGLRPMARHHVHLSSDTATAYKVGQRHGPPLILQIDAAELYRQGHVFYQAANGVWLTDSVPVTAIRRLE